MQNWKGFFLDGLGRKSLLEKRHFLTKTVKSSNQVSALVLWK
jgi:hypothetical protein